MPTYTDVIFKEWFNEYKNGVDATSNTTDKTGTIKGNFLDKVRVLFEVSVYTYEFYNGFQLSTSVIKADGDFTKDISAGDNITVVLKGGSLGSAIIVAGDVITVSPKTIYWTQTSGAPNFTDLQTFDSDVVAAISVNSDLTYLDFKYGLVGSNLTDSYNSALDDRTQRIIKKDIDPNYTFNAEYSNNNYKEGSFLVRSNGRTTIPNAHFNFTGNNAQKFFIEHTFLIENYNDEIIDNITEGTLPDNYLGELTLDYTAEFEFRVDEQLPETAKTGKYRTSGEVGFLNENLNGRISKYSISNVQIQRKSSLVEIDNITFNERSIVSFDIDPTANSFDTTPHVIVKHFTLRKGDYYEFSNLDFKDIFQYSSVIVPDFTDDNGIFNAQITSSTSNKLSVSFEVGDFMLNGVIDNTLDGEEYLLCVAVGDYSNTMGATDIVTLPIKTGVYKNDFDVEGLATNQTLFYNRFCDPDTETGYEVAKGALDDLLLAQSKISIVKDASIFRLEFGLFIDNGVDDPIAVDTEFLPLLDFKTINNVQRINNTYSSGYLSLYEPFEQIKMKYIDSDATHNNYEFTIPYRFQSQDHIEVENLPDVFFDDTLVSNGRGLNLLTLNNHGYNTKIGFRYYLLYGGRTTQYLFLNEMNVINYETII